MLAKSESPASRLESIMTITTPEHPDAEDSTPPRPRTKRVLWIVGAAAAAFALVLGTVGITAAVLDDDSDDDGLEARALIADEDLISPQQATALAVAAVGGGTATDVDLDDEAGRFVYEIEVHHGTSETPSESDVVIDARTGEVLSTVD
jgi:uncharacterized membrane protein YkoI